MQTTESPTEGQWGRKPRASKPAAQNGDFVEGGDRSPHDPESLLRHLEWTVIRRLDGILQGDYRTLFRGFGIDLADLREHQPQDDVRYIDWNVTARLGQPYVRTANEEREVTAWFIADYSPSLDFGPPGRRKRDLASAFIAVMARLLMRHGNRVAAILHRERDDEFVAAKAGRLQVLALLARIERLIERPLTARPGSTRLDRLLSAAASRIKRRSTVFVLTDFIGPPGWSSALARLAQRHEVVAVRLFDPREQALPIGDSLMMLDPETGERLWVDTRDRGFMRRYESMAFEAEEAVRAGLVSASVDCLELSTEAPIDAAILRFSKLRKQRSQLASGVQWRAL